MLLCPAGMKALHKQSDMVIILRTETQHVTVKYIEESVMVKEIFPRACIRTG